MNNTIYLRRCRKLMLTRGTAALPDRYVAALLENLVGLGHTLSPELVEVVQTLSLDGIETFYLRLVADLKEELGAKVTYAPMYPNFPRQVMEAERGTLTLNAMLHYLGDWVGARIMPVYAKERRSPLGDGVALRVIELGSEEEFIGICRDLIGAKTSLSEQDRLDLAWFVQAYRDRLDAIFPAEIPHRETLAYVTGLLLRYGLPLPDGLMARFGTATDVLRLATALSDGDTSLAANTKFRNFRRSERRQLLGLLERIRNAVEDMLRYRERWIRLGERLHPAEYGKHFPRSAEAFAILRENRPVPTFNGKLEQCLLQKRVPDAMALLKTRPGEFARRLDHLLRLSAEHRQPVVEAFAAVAAKVSTPVLLQVMAHFRNRNRGCDLRVFFPKGNVAKAQAIDNELPAIEHSVCHSVAETCAQALVARFRELPSLGSVFLDPALANYPVPFSQRSASKALRSIARGSRLDLPMGDTLRFFLWWREGTVDGKHTGRVDIDLSAVMYDADWRYLEHISYTNLRSHKYQAAHSGDITSAPNGACEFIDLHLPSIVAYGGRYVVVSLLSYTQQPYCNLPECYAGWMGRQKPQSGEVFEPATVVDRIDVTADTRICVPTILDLVDRCMVWTDLSLTSNPRWQNNVEGNQKGMLLMGKALTTMARASLHELFALHCEARGTLVDEPADADTVFSVDRGITPFDTAEIMGRFL